MKGRIFRKYYEGHMDKTGGKDESSGGSEFGSGRGEWLGKNTLN